MSESTRRDHAALAVAWAGLWSTDDLSRAHTVFASDFLDHRTAPFHDIHGIQEAKQFIQKIRSAFPDLEVRIADLLVDRDRIAVRVNHAGTHRGRFLGHSPTGRRIRYEGTVIFRVARNLIVERWGTVDLHAILLQIGEGDFTSATRSSSDTLAE